MANTPDDNLDFGYWPAIAGFIAAAALIVLMFATSGQV